MKKLRAGVVGLGYISEGHAQTYKQNVNTELTAICDIDEPWLKCAKDIYEVGQIYTDYREMLEKADLDVISVCVPTYLHAEVAIAALKKGINVLCEKPTATSAVEATAMRDAELKGGAKLMIGQNQRFDPCVQEMRKMYDRGDFGTVYQTRVGWRRPLGGFPLPCERRPNGSIYSRNWFNEKDKGGGVLRDLGSHMIDQMLFILNFPELEGAYANSYRKFMPPGTESGEYTVDAEDLCAGYIKFKNGVGMQIEVSHGSLVEKESLFARVYGTKMGGHKTDGRFLITKAQPDGSFTVEEPSEKDLPQMKFRHTADYFIDALVNDLPVPVSSEQGIKVIEVLDALYAASKNII